MLQLNLGISKHCQDLAIRCILLLRCILVFPLLQRQHYNVTIFV